MLRDECGICSGKTGKYQGENRYKDSKYEAECIFMPFTSNFIAAVRRYSARNGAASTEEAQQDGDPYVHESLAPFALQTHLLIALCRELDYVQSKIDRAVSIAAVGCCCIFCWNFN